MDGHGRTDFKVCGCIAGLAVKSIKKKADKPRSHQAILYPEHTTPAANNAHRAKDARDKNKPQAKKPTKKLQCQETQEGENDTRSTSPTLCGSHGL